MEKEEQTVDFTIQKRRLLVIWVYTLKQLKNLRRFGEVVYTSKKMKYVVLYMNEEAIKETQIKIARLHFVRRVEMSYRPDIEMNFAERIGTRAALEFSDDGFEIEELNTTIRLAKELS